MVYLKHVIVEIFHSGPEPSILSKSKILLSCSLAGCILNQQNFMV